MNPQNPQQPPVKIAIDVGTTKVVAVAGRRNQHNKIEILGYSVLQNTGMVQGEIFNLLETTHTIRHVKEELSQKLDMPIRKVTVGISGDHIRTVYTREYITRDDPNELIGQADLDRLSESARKSITLGPDEEILEVIPQVFLVDNRVVRTSPVGTLGKRFEASFMVVVGRVDKIEKLRRSLDQAGLEVENIYLQPIASARAVLLEPQCSLGIALLDIGGGTSDILICNKGKIRFAGVIPYGGDYITEEIAHKFKLDPKMAEVIKIRSGSVLVDKHDLKKIIQFQPEWSPRPMQIKMETLANTIRFKMSSIANAIDRFFNEYREYFPGEDINLGLVVTGGGSQLGNLVQYLQFELGIDVIAGEPRALLAPSPMTERLGKPPFATVVGLLDMALDNAAAEPEEPENQPDRETEENQTQSMPAGDDATPETRPKSRNPEKKKRKWFSFFTDFRNSVEEAIDQSNQ